MELKSLSCVDAGVFKGYRSDNFEEFIRTFRKKYHRAGYSEQTRIEIVGNDQLGGRAKSIFLSLPEKVKREGFDKVVTELGFFWPRIRSLVEWRPSQSYVI